MGLEYNKWLLSYKVKEKKNQKTPLMSENFYFFLENSSKTNYNPWWISKSCEKNWAARNNKVKDEKITRAVESQLGRETNVGHYWSEKERQRNGIAYQKLTMFVLKKPVLLNSAGLVQTCCNNPMCGLQHLKAAPFHSYCSQTCYWLSQP